MQPCHNPCGQGLPPRPLFDKDGNFKVPGSVIAQNYVFRGPDGDITGTLSVFENTLFFTDPDGVSQPITNSDKSIIGSWVNVTKTDDSELYALWIMDKVDSGIQVTVYAGYPGRYREWTAADLRYYAPDPNFWGIDIPPQKFPLVEVTPQQVNAHPTKGERYFLMNPYKNTNPRYLSIQQRQAILVLTRDEVSGEPLCQVYYYDVPNTISFDTMYSYDRLMKLPARPPIETATSINPDNNNPQEMLRQFFKNITLFGNSQMNVNIGASDYPGYPALEYQLQKLLTTGVIYPATTVKDVWLTRTPNAANPGYGLTTTFITEGPVNVRVGGRLFVSGFINQYAVLNNTDDGWFIPYSGDNFSFKTPPQTYDPEYVVISSEIFLVSPQVNTTGLPAYDPDQHGVAQVEMRVAAINPASGYSDLMAAVYDLTATMGRNTHLVPLGFSLPTAPIRFPQTFEQLNTIINGSFGQRGAGSRQRGVVRPVSNYMNYIGVASISSSAPVPANDPTGIRARDPIFLNANNNITRRNYLLPENTNTLYYRLTGPELPGAPVTGPRLLEITGGFYKVPGSKFEFVRTNYYAGNPDPAVYNVYGGSIDTLIFGIINPDRTEDVPMGYIFLNNTLLFDVGGGGASLFQDFSPSYPAAYIPYLTAWAEVFRYFRANNVETFIFDNSANNGGNGITYITLASFFGANRPGVIDSISRADTGYTDLITLPQIAREIELSGFDQYITGTGLINCDMTAALYPELVFRDPKYKLICLTSINAVSSGDILPHLLRNVGPDPSNLGFGVRCYIVGDIDGRNVGYNSLQIPLFTDNNSRIKQGDVPFSPMFTTCDCLANFNRANDANGENGYSLANQNPAIKPDVLLDSSIAATWWLDTGYSQNLPVPVLYPLNPADGGTDPFVLPLSTGVTQPQPLNPDTWRYRWLEAAIIVALHGVVPALSARKGLFARKVKPFVSSLPSDFKEYDYVPFKDGIVDSENGDVKCKLGEKAREFKTVVQPVEDAAPFKGIRRAAKSAK